MPERGVAHREAGYCSDADLALQQEQGGREAKDIDG